MVKALKTTPRVSKISQPALTPRNNNPKSATKVTRGKEVAKVKFHTNRIK